MSLSEKPVSSTEAAGGTFAFGTSAIYQHPLAYLVGMEGVALLRGFAGDYDREFIEARLAETRALLDSAHRFGDALMVNPITTTDGYDGWSADYDEPGNGLIDLEQPIVREMLAGLPIGVALDAACGTGRHTEYLASLGHQVIGVDSSSGMLAKARAKVPDGEFHLGDLHCLPVLDDHVDVVVCTLALTHVRDLAPVLAEFARVLRPGGHLVISDVRGFMINAHAYPLVKAGPDGRQGYIPHWHHQTSDYLAAALPLDLHVRSCFEPRFGDVVDPDSQPEPLPAHTVADPWLLHSWATEATNATYRDLPVAIFWHFQLADS
jgi:ubiquinone/menaquinone biosynthesis C-methylase UbiE